MIYGGVVLCLLFILPLVLIIVYFVVYESEAALDAFGLKGELEIQ